MRLRVITGELGGRIFNSPPGHVTYPMGEKVRGALFNILGDIEGLTIFDTYAGSGAISFEALSRGAKHAFMMDDDKFAIRTIKENIEALGLEDRTTVTQGNVKGWSNNNAHKHFDIVICDPPYDAVLETVIHKLARHVERGGSLVVSWPSSEPIPTFDDLEPLRHKTYGNATLAFYKKTG